MWTSISGVIIALVFIGMAFRNRDSIKALFEKSNAAPQHWGTFWGLMAVVMLFVYLLIKL